MCVCVVCVCVCVCCVCVSCVCVCVCVFGLRPRKCQMPGETEKQRGRENGKEICDCEKKN